LGSKKERNVLMMWMTFLIKKQREKHIRNNLHFKVVCEGKVGRKNQKEKR